MYPILDTITGYLLLVLILTLPLLIGLSIKAITEATRDHR
jgi:hypothetical protein